MQFTDIGIVSSLEVNHKSVEQARPGTEVCIRVESTGDAPRLYGRHFDHEDMLVSKVSFIYNYNYSRCVKIFEKLLVIFVE